MHDGIWARSFLRARPRSVRETLITGLVGVVTSDEPNDLERTPDYEAMTRSLSVICKEQLIGALKGFQPDIINWRGGNYIVKHVNPYPHFGQGFFEITCTSINFMDLPFTNALPLPGRMAFNFAKQSYLVPLCY
jgi:hypothetical protein